MLFGNAQLERKILPREQQACRSVPAFDRGDPCHRGLHRIAGAPDIHVRNQAQAGCVFDRLVRGSVFAQADGIVGEHEQDSNLHQRCHAQRVARIVRERKEGPAVGNQPAVQCHAVHDRRHAELAHAVINIVAAAAFADAFRSRPQREIRAGQVGRTTHQLRQRGCKCFDRVLRSLATGDGLGFFIDPGEKRLPHAGASSAVDRLPCGA